MSKTLTKYYTINGIVIGVLVEGINSVEFIWNMHPFDWYKFLMTDERSRDEYGNEHTAGDFRDMLLRTKTWNLANVGRIRSSDEELFIWEPRKHEEGETS